MDYIMKKDTTMINLDVKSNLAKLIASENLTIQHNNVKTASFNTKDRILTLPIFKEQSGDVYDMLIAHECAHALYTPADGWEKIASDDELRSYVNVLEDTRIDKLIQAKYPGVVRNYENGFDILEKKNFFGLLGKDINKELMAIDKINLRSKSLNRLPFSFNQEEIQWSKKVDAIVTFDDVVALAKEMLNWQKKQVEELKKLPEFDEHPLMVSYGLNEDEDESDEENDYGASGDDNEDTGNFGDQDSENSDQDVQDTGSGDGEEENEENKSSSKPTDFNSNTDVGGGKDIAPKDFKPKQLKSITNESYEQRQQELVKDTDYGYVYGNYPMPNFGDGTALIQYKEFLSRFRTHIADKRQKWQAVSKYEKWIKNEYKKFNNENKKTVMYLVKEFEMKKAATAYKRAQTNKTGIIDPLKLPSYKYNDDIFKKLTIVPDGKNHGMVMLLDWSGSMADTLMNTVEQLINLVQFVKKVNIPFEVYFFTSERHKESGSWIKKVNDFQFDEFSLVNCASHKMNKKELEEALTYLFSMAKDYDDRYTWRRRDDYYSYLEKRGESYDMPREFNLGNTPLNEALIYMTHMVPMFKKKYGIEKLTFITLTDGGANSNCNYKIVDKSQVDGDKTWLHQEDGFGRESFHGCTMIINRKKKKFVIDRYYGGQTSTLLDIIKSENDTTNVGFYILKRIRRWDLERYIGDYKDYYDREKKYTLMRKQMTKEKSVIVDKNGYNKYFLLDGKSMNVENFNMDSEKVKKGTVSEFKRIFGKSMKNRLVSRVVLNKFIAEVA